MNAPAPLATYASPQKTPASMWSSIRILAFPVLTNVWLLLLYVSQKAFVLPGLVLVGAGDAAYRRDLMTALFVSVVSLLVYVTQYANSYDQVHLLGFLFFAWSMPLINHAIRYDPILLRRVLTYFTVFNAAMGFYLLYTNIDLYGLRGLNKIEDSVGTTQRVYFESASMAAVILLSSFRNRAVKIAALTLVIAFVLFVAKSVVVIALLGLNLAWPYFLRSSPHVKVGAAIFAVFAAVLLYKYLFVIRPDIELSLLVKQWQLDVIIGLLGGSWSGFGWGFFIPQLASDRAQPYQIEMQLPLLVLQVGPIALIAILVSTLALFLSAAEQRLMGFVRFAAYALIGFNNPWLFLPSWYLTCQLLFRDDNDPDQVRNGEAQQQIR
ncbi:hypothetical protein [Sphingomonas sp. LaA6.9]|uniref:hypothetical protein n=1 Tax=Sphingomonas sp. LaA6.9 TaxID=2919914 RepID=UPI001F4F22AF|nr:hypothetical protein [Sphingomonas sp. LaA6.9]MCJ8159693.1 hypothetical protein [Sphingomonas sp. LaA6.9]